MRSRTRAGSPGDTDPATQQTEVAGTNRVIGRSLNRVKIIACLEEAAVIQKILNHLKDKAAADETARALSASVGHSAEGPVC